MHSVRLRRATPIKQLSSGRHDSLLLGMSGMSDKTFIDTNVLIYAHDVDAKGKHEVAQRILRELWSERTGALSMQVLQEFYVNVTRKIAKPLPQRRNPVGGKQLFDLVHRNNASGDRIRIPHRRRVPHRVLGCAHRGIGGQVKSSEDSLRGLECSTNDRRHPRRKSLSRIYNDIKRRSLGAPPFISLCPLLPASSSSCALFISSGDTSSTCVATPQRWPKGS